MCFDHETMFWTRTDIRLAIRISNKSPIVCRGLEVKKASKENKVCLDMQPMNDTVESLRFSKKKMIRAPM